MSARPGVAGARGGYELECIGARRIPSGVQPPGDGLQAVKDKALTGGSVD